MIPGVLYDFNLKNVVTFEDNLKYKRDVPFCVYVDFETTAPTDDYLNPENKSMHAVSYSLIFAWHPEFCLSRQMLVSGYNHSLEEFWKVRENQLFVPLIGHNFSGFDIYYMVKGYRLSVWGTKDFTMGGTNLINVNFANIFSQVKIIDTLKYYQTSLANISSTAKRN